MMGGWAEMSNMGEAFQVVRNQKHRLWHLGGASFGWLIILQLLSRSHFSSSCLKYLLAGQWYLLLALLLIVSHIQPHAFSVTYCLHGAKILKVEGTSAACVLFACHRVSHFLRWGWRQPLEPLGLRFNFGLKHDEGIWPSLWCSCVLLINVVIFVSFLNLRRT